MHTLYILRDVVMSQSIYFLAVKMKKEGRVCKFSYSFFLTQIKPKNLKTVIRSHFFLDFPLMYFFIITIQTHLFVSDCLSVLSYHIQIYMHIYIILQ